MEPLMVNYINSLIDGVQLVLRLENCEVRDLYHALDLFRVKKDDEEAINILSYVVERLSNLENSVYEAYRLKYKLQYIIEHARGIKVDTDDMYIERCTIEHILQYFKLALRDGINKSYTVDFLHFLYRVDYEDYQTIIDKMREDVKWKQQRLKRKAPRYLDEIPNKRKRIVA